MRARASSFSDAATCYVLLSLKIEDKKLFVLSRCVPVFDCRRSEASTLALTPIWLVYASLSTEISDLEGEVVLFYQIPIGDI